MLKGLFRTAAGALLTIAIAGTARAQDTTRTPADSAQKLGSVHITAERETTPKIGILQAATLPVTQTITARKIDETINIVDPEDAVKYLPSIFLRKRNYGDTQAIMETRVWGVSSSARSLIFADDVPLTALIANNNSIGGLRWGWFRRSRSHAST